MIAYKAFKRNPEAWRNILIGRGAILAPSVSLGDSLIIEHRAKIAPNVRIGRGVYIGDNVTIGRGAILHEGCNVWPGAKIGAGAVMGKDSEIENGAEIEARAILGRAARIGQNTKIGHGAAIGERAVIGPGVRIGAQATIGAFAHLSDCDLAPRAEIAALSYIDQAWLIVRPLICLSIVIEPIGSRDDRLTIVLHHKAPPMFKTGCFLGWFERFESLVNLHHDRRARSEYRAAIALALALQPRADRIGAGRGSRK